MQYMSDDYLGKAAHQKQLAKEAIKSKRLDDAWKHLNEQKILYLRHASKSEYTFAQTRALEAVPHEDMANILRIEKNNRQALAHIAFVYVCTVKNDRSKISIEKKLLSYFNRVYKGRDFERFVAFLVKQKEYSFDAVQGFVLEFYPQSKDEVE